MGEHEPVRVVLRVFGRRERLTEFVKRLEALAKDLAKQASASFVHQAYWKIQELDVSGTRSC